MSRSFSPATDMAVRVGVNTTAAATTAVNGATIDTAGYEGVMFLVKIGTAAANNNIKIQQSAASDFADPADLDGSTVASGTNTILWAQVRRPTKRYLRVVVTRGTSTTVDWGVAMVFGARSLPQDNAPTGTAGVALVSPAEAE